MELRPLEEGVQWINDGYKDIISGFQIEAIRHSEKKWYKGVPQIEIIREIMPDDLLAYPPENEIERNERIRCLNRKLKEGRQYLTCENGSVVLSKEWWGFPARTEWKSIQTLVTAYLRTNTPKL